MVPCSYLKKPLGQQLSELISTKYHGTNNVSRFRLRRFTPNSSKRSRVIRQYTCLFSFYYLHHKAPCQNSFAKEVSGCESCGKCLSAHFDPVETTNSVASHELVRVTAGHVDCTPSFLAFTCVSVGDLHRRCGGGIVGCQASIKLPDDYRDC